MDLASRDDGKEGERVRDGGIGSILAGINECIRDIATVLTVHVCTLWD